jgi:hypothetical protein
MQTCCLHSEKTGQDLLNYTHPTAIHFFFAFGHLVGEFSCCFKNSGCDILTAEVND